MPKKHRVKRQNYVTHLLKLEKERTAYLEKRCGRRRNREDRNNEEVMGAARDAMESGAAKKRRTEAPESLLTAEEEHTMVPSVRKGKAVSIKPTSSPPLTNSAAAATAAKGQNGIFSSTPFEQFVMNSAAAAEESPSSTQASEVPRSATATKKVTQRRRY